MSARTEQKFERACANVPFEVVSDAPLDGTALLRGAPRDSGGLIRDAAALWSSLPLEVELLGPGDRDFLEMMLLCEGGMRHAHTVETQQQSQDDLNGNM